MYLIVTRTQKYNNRDHAGLADGTAPPEEHLPRYFTKSGNFGEAPNKVKKEGGGKGNWGHPGDEAHDMGYNFATPRRQSNSSAHKVLSDFTTKFEAPEEDPFFEDHMGTPEDYDSSAGDHELKKQDTIDSVDSASTSGGSTMEDKE